VFVGDHVMRLIMSKDEGLRKTAWFKVVVVAQRG